MGFPGEGKGMMDGPLAGSSGALLLPARRGGGHAFLSQLSLTLPAAIRANVQQCLFAFINAAGIKKGARERKQKKALLSLSLCQARSVLFFGARRFKCFERAAFLRASNVGANDNLN